MVHVGAQQERRSSLGIYHGRVLNPCWHAFFLPMNLTYGAARTLGGVCTLQEGQMGQQKDQMGQQKDQRKPGTHYGDCAFRSRHDRADSR